MVQQALIFKYRKSAKMEPQLKGNRGEHVTNCLFFCGEKKLDFQSLVYHLTETLRLLRLIRSSRVLGSCTGTNTTSDDPN